MLVRGSQSIENPSAQLLNGHASPVARLVRRRYRFQVCLACIEPPAIFGGHVLGGARFNSKLPPLRPCECHGGLTWAEGPYYRMIGALVGRELPWVVPCSCSCL